VVSQNIFRKVIRGVEVLYESKLDIISYGNPSGIRSPFNRTQVCQSFDLCAEITTKCNLACQNCFSDSFKGKYGIHLGYQSVYALLRQRYAELIRFCITGGEPFMHPEIESFLEIPRDFPGLGHVISTNGTLRADLDDSLIRNGWLVAISLHGRQESHNLYSGCDSFDIVRRRIESLAARTRVHIYCVLHDALTIEDVDWIFQFRDDTGAMFLRFIIPREFGRYRPLHAPTKIDEIATRLDECSGLKVEASKTSLLGVSGLVRHSA